MLREALEALDREEFEDWLKYEGEYSAQDIAEMIAALERHTRSVVYYDKKTIRWLKKLKPELLLTGETYADKQNVDLLS